MKDTPKAFFESYVETNEEDVVSNTNCGQIFPGILFVTTGNIQVTPKGFDIITGVKKKYRTIRNLTMPQAVDKYVHDWAKRSAREEHQNKMLFLDRNT